MSDVRLCVAYLSLEYATLALDEPLANRVRDVMDSVWLQLPEADLDWLNSRKPKQIDDSRGMNIPAPKDNDDPGNLLEAYLYLEYARTFLLSDKSLAGPVLNAMARVRLRLSPTECEWLNSRQDLLERNKDGNTLVLRDSKRALGQKARELGARAQQVTQGGYTQLPPEMISDLRMQDGGALWLVRGPDQWEAWPEEQLERLLGGDRKQTVPQRPASAVGDPASGSSFKQRGINLSLFVSIAPVRVPGSDFQIRYDQVVLRKQIHGFAPGEEFDVAILDPIEGTLTLYRDCDRFGANDPSEVVRVGLALKEEPAGEQ